MPASPHTFSRIGLTSALAIIPLSSNAVFSINLNILGTMPPEVSAAFDEGAAFWESKINNDITVNLDIRFDGNDPGGNPMGANTLGSTGRSLITPTYSAVRATLIAQANPSANDLTAIANLPAAGTLSFRTNETGATNNGDVFTDNDGSNNNTFLDVNTANAKALGLRAANDPGTDAQVAFNPTFDWDFDPSDGIDPGHQDFVGVTIHEIGHALGFRSGVDAVDARHGAGPFAPEDLDSFAVVTVLDLFRFSSPGQMDLATGGTPYFSLDGGTTNIAPFSTGAFNGDGAQASHWKDNLGLGILDPTANPPGQVNVVTQLDLDALDVIGFDVNPIPEPTSTLLALVALGFTAQRRKR